MGGLADGFGICPAVVPVLVGPLQVLLTILPGLLLALIGGLFGLLKPSGMKNLLLLLWRQKIAVASIAAIATGLYFGAKKIWPRGVAGVVMSAQQGSDWPTARGDLTRCAAVVGSASPTRDELKWSYRPSDEGFLASPAVVGNRVYISSAQLGAFSKSGAIHCLDADTGAVVWTSRPTDYRPTFSSPVIAGDYLVCGEGLHDTRDARVVCLDLRDQGKVLWTFRTNNHVECTPVVANGRVYFGAGDDGVYCLDLQPGPDGQAKLHWHKPPEQFPDSETSLAVHDGKVYVGLGNDGAALVVLDAVTGDELHRLKMPYPVFSPPSIAGGKLYLGMGNGDYVKPGKGGAVVCLNLKTLKTEWTYDLPQTVLGAVAVKDDKLYFGCNDGQVYCLSRAGKLIKQFNAFAPIKTSPAVTDAHVFVVTDAGLLFALDRHSFEPEWQFRLGTDGLFISSPVVARGHVYVGTEKEGLLCVGKPASSKRTPRWSAPLGGPGVAGNSDSSPIAEAGEIYWIYQASDSDKNSLGAITGPVAVWDDRIYVARSRGLECLPIEKEGRTPPRPVWTFPVDGQVLGSPVVLGNTVAFVTAARNENPGQLYLLDRATGTARAQRVLGATSHLLTATPHQFLVEQGALKLEIPAGLASYDEHGNHQWTASISMVSAVASNDSMILAVAGEIIIALDRASGRTLWFASVPHFCNETPLFDKRSFLLMTWKGLESRSLIDGQVLTSWTIAGKREETTHGLPLPLAVNELAVAERRVLVVNHEGEVVVFDRDTGKITCRAPGALPGQAPLVSRGKVIYAAAGRLLTFTLNQQPATPELWLDLSALPPILSLSQQQMLRGKPLPTGPLVLRDSRLFTVLPGRGLACLGGAK